MRKRGLAHLLFSSLWLLACTGTSQTPPVNDAGVGVDAEPALVPDSGLPDAAAASDASSSDASPGEPACTSAVATTAAEDIGTFAAQGAPEGHVCADPEVSVSSSKYSTGRALFKFNVGAAAAAKLTAGAVQNLRLRVTLSHATANAGQVPCLVGPPGNQINNCMFAFAACPVISTWTEAPETSCATQLLQNPSTNTSWPDGTFMTTCASGTPMDFAVASTHAEEVVEIPLSAAVLGPFVSGGTVSVYMPPLSAYSAFRVYAHESADPAKRPQLLFTCNP